MANDSPRRAGDVFGAYTLIEIIGGGGNADVWKASAPNGHAAVKVLRRYRSAEPYARFKREVEQLQKLGEDPGVLPYLDSSLPEHPTVKNPPWLAMPVATPLHIALGPAPDAQTVVHAVAAIATTLASLHSRGVSHRDIKPDNLYHHEGRWLIGDFGLVDAPDVEPLTEGANNLGPRHYLAPEMISQPASADGAAADVYSLGKTLWVLLTGQRFPPPGEQRLDNDAVRVSAYRPEPNMYPLDLLLETMTRHEPKRRPTAAMVAAELASWGRTPTTAPATADLSAFAERANQAVRGATATSQRRERRTSAVAALMTELSQRAGEIGRRCRASGLPVRDTHRSPHGDFQFDASPYIAETLGLLATKSAMGEDPPVTLGGSMMVSAHADTPALRIWIAVSAIPRHDPEVILLAGSKIIDARATILDDIWTLQKRVVLGGPQQAGAIAELVADMLVHLPDDVSRWTTAVEQHAARQ
jgi:hypothetical protein